MIADKKELIRRGAALAALVLFAVASILLLYRYDNKYTQSGPQPIGGLLVLSEQDLQQTPVLYLVREWEFFPGVLLSPADFSGKTPEVYRRYLDIGQSGSFGASPLSTSHGSATYRLTLDLPAPARSYTLHLPEIFSCYTLYLNDGVVVQMGDLAAYREAIQERLFTFTAAGRVQLLLAVSNHSGEYSGLIYPPAFGLVDSVLQRRDTRLLLHTLGMVFAALACLLSLLLGLRGEWNKGILFALCCLCYIGITSYPLLHTFWQTAYHPWYALEILCYYLLLFLTVALLNRLCGIWDSPWHSFALPFLLGGAVSLLFIFCTYGGDPRLLHAFSLLSSLIKYGVSFYLIAVSGYGFMVGRQRFFLMLGASLIFGVVLLFDRVFPICEPVFGGWFTEIGSFLLISTLAYVLWSDLGDAYRFRLSFAAEKEQLLRQLDMQKEHYQQLFQQMEAARIASHDLRHHMRALRSFAERDDLAEIRTYLESYEFHARGQELQTFSNSPVADAMLRYYGSAARRAHTRFDAVLNLPTPAGLPDDDLCILLSNLLENALEACSRQTSGERFIYLRGSVKDGKLGLVVDNSFEDGTLKLKDGLFYSSKRHGLGLGIRSVQTVVRKYYGLCSFSPEDGVFKASLLIPLPPDGGASPASL
ncbi:MAG: GHKL domain-containing protein [Oscillospiraceae bacterium]|nr:GHKL domain-containing protein [Oscillospiraceae bacterium]